MLLSEILQFEAVNRVRQLDLVHRNFIQLNLAFAEQHSYIIADSPSMTTDDILSNIGGTFSLWLGMNLMFLVEIVELLIRLVYIVFTNKRNKTTVIQVRPLDADK